MPQTLDLTDIGLETYLIRTFGCQMNKHDSERIGGMLESLGMLPVGDIERLTWYIHDMRVSRRQTTSSTARSPLHEHPSPHCRR